MKYYLERNLPRLLCFFTIQLGVQLLVPGSAPAAPVDKQAQENAARRACLDGNYTQGVGILTELFVEFKDVTYIFNQGRCFEQNRRYEDAIARFQEYMRAGRKTLDEGGKAEAEERIAECQAMLDQERRAAQAAASRPLVASQPQASKPAGTVAATAPRSSAGAGLRIGGVVLTLVGLAAAGTGIALNVKANNVVSDMYKVTDGYKTESDRKSYETMAWVSYAVGAACVATGVILYGVGLGAKSKAVSNIALVPVVGNGQAGTVLAGTF
jgi:hypothetical protein